LAPGKVELLWTDKTENQCRRRLGYHTPAFPGHFSLTEKSTIGWNFCCAKVKMSGSLAIDLVKQRWWWRRRRRYYDWWANYFSS